MTEPSNAGASPSSPEPSWSGTSACTSSPASGVGTSPSASPVGPTIDPSGPGVAPASLFPPPTTYMEINQGFLAVSTFGPSCGTSSESDVLQSSLENKLRARLGENGSPEFGMTWRRWDISSGRPICALRGSARRTSGNVFIGWATPVATDSNHGSFKFHAGRRERGLPEACFRLGDQVILDLGTPTWRSSRGIPEKDIAWKLNPEHSRWLMGFPDGWGSFAVTATRFVRRSRRSS